MTDSLFPSRNSLLPQDGFPVPADQGNECYTVVITNRSTIEIIG